MPGATRPQLGNELFGQMINVQAVTFPTLAANATGSNTLAVAGVLPGDMVSWNMQSPPLHLVLDNAFVSAAGVITILWSSDATGISTGTVQVLFEILRCENQSLGTAGFPTSLS